MLCISRENMMEKEKGLVVNGIFEIVWEEVRGKSVGYSRDSLHPVKVKLVPFEGKTWKDIMDFYMTHTAVSGYTLRKIKQGVADGRVRNIGGLNFENSMYDVVLDKKVGVFYQVHVGGHYITQHWADILPEGYRDIISRISIIEPDSEKHPCLKFETLEYEVLYVPLHYIVNYFVRGWEGKMNHDQIGEVFHELLELKKDEESRKECEGVKA